jgi:hypothetical protein
MVIHSRLLEELGIPGTVYVEVLRYFHRVDRCVYLGELAVEVGWSTERMEQVVAALVSSGTVRPATDEEKFAVDAPRDSNVYVLTEPRNLELAFKE